MSEKKIRLTRERIVGASFNAKSTDEKYRLDRLRSMVIDDQLSPWTDPGWTLRSIEIVSTKDDPDNHKYPEWNQMVIVKALVREEKLETL